MATKLTSALNIVEDALAQAQAAISEEMALTYSDVKAIERIQGQIHDLRNGIIRQHVETNEKLAQIFGISAARVSQIRNNKSRPK